jgi:hypothetical protein
MRYDVYCLQSVSYVSTGEPFETACQDALNFSEESPARQYLVVEPDDTIVAVYKGGKRYLLVDA